MPPIHASSRQAAIAGSASGSACTGLPPASSVIEATTASLTAGGTSSAIRPEGTTITTIGSGPLGAWDCAPAGAASASVAMSMADRDMAGTIAPGRQR